jgi:ATP-dependent Clp protease adaptor protein ClpS
MTIGVFLYPEMMFFDIIVLSAKNIILNRMNDKFLRNDDLLVMSSDDGMEQGDNHDSGMEEDTGLLLEARPKTKKPSMYKVLLLNDDYTPMEFVVHIVEKFFAKNRAEATDIMMHVHRRGVGICGIFTYEIAETKVAQVMDYARANEQPLQCTMEKE